MPTRELHNQILTKQGSASATVTASVTNGAIIDTKGFESFEALLHAHTVTTADASNYFTLKLYVGDDSALADGAYASGGDVLGSAVINDATFDETEYRLGYVGIKRYVRIDIVVTGTVSAILATTALLAFPRLSPTTGA